MRSRFSAYAVGDVDYVRRTWHSTTRPRDLALDPGVRWYRLDVLDTSHGGLLDDCTVELRAYYRAGSGAGSQHEVGRFVREDGEWAYLDGIVQRTGIVRSWQAG
jgi:SEC-C motif-containing protein